ncbi:3-phenylpropionate/cinnamic acid dioxygenase subunit beta [Amycolatopsis sp. RM579]|uniref:3-phenylpropionate/cinnamic acid dioxygenase subunit beta n=2 Tax=Amycolatopsis pithecellobii TaxID=664692 RepID=A0A6N7YUT1_9PSEU|nr:3-phenylpropionate/cinnamic acid dioxygenase subunit beta [Amycolatopsis pithecellobii]
MLRQYQVEKFYHDEAALLDAHDYEHWVELFSEDTHYFMPIRRTRLRRELRKEFTKPGEMAYFDDDKAILTARWKKLASGSAWAEDPPSRTRHLITNVRITEDRDDELSVESNFHVYRTRLKSDADSWVGSRQDVLRRDGDSFLIAKRLILLEQTVLLARNLSTMF